MVDNYYNVTQVVMAQQRYREVSGKKPVKFWEWIGFTHNVGEYLDMMQGIRIAADIRPNKIELLLSPHYKALYKAYEIQNNAHNQ